MFCQNCGTQNPVNATRCIRCGAALSVQPAPQPIQQQYAVRPQSNAGKGFAIPALICGIVAITFFWFFFGFYFTPGICAIIFGAIAKNKGYQGGMATTGIVLGAIGLGLAVIAIAVCGAFYAELFEELFESSYYYY